MPSFPYLLGAHGEIYATSLIMWVGEKYESEESYIDRGDACAPAAIKGSQIGMERRETPRVDIR